MPARGAGHQAFHRRLHAALQLGNLTRVDRLLQVLMSSASWSARFVCIAMAALPRCTQPNSLANLIATYNKPYG